PHLVRRGGPERAGEGARVPLLRPRGVRARRDRSRDDAAAAEVRERAFWPALAAVRDHADSPAHDLLTLGSNPRPSSVSLEFDDDRCVRPWWLLPGPSSSSFVREPPFRRRQARPPLERPMEAARFR